MFCCRPYSFDAGFLSRFAGKLYVPLPDENLKEEFLFKSIQSKNMHVDVELEDIRKLLKNYCEGISLRELEFVVNEAILNGPLKRLETATHFIYNDLCDNYIACFCNSPECFGEVRSHLSIPAEKLVMPEIQCSDLRKAAGNMKPSNDEAMINDNFLFSQGIVRKNADGVEQNKDNDGKIKASTGYASCIGLVIILILLISCVLFVELFMY